MRKPKGLGATLLAIWLILMGADQLIHLHFTGLEPLMGILALLAGVLLVAGR